MQHSGQDQAEPMAFEMSLRDQLIAAQNEKGPEQGQAQVLQHPGPSHDAYRQDEASSPHDPPIDPAMGGSAEQDYHMEAQEYGMTDEALAALQAVGKGPRQRELSQSKRAAQNRAAQRAFRQRKEQYITKLEKQVNEMRVRDDDLKHLQEENYKLREYVLSLQARLLESSADVPPPPARISIHGDPSLPSLQRAPVPIAPPQAPEDSGPVVLVDIGHPTQEEYDQMEAENAAADRLHAHPGQQQHHHHGDPSAAQGAPQASMGRVTEEVPLPAMEQLQAAAVADAATGAGVGAHGGHVDHQDRPE